MEYMGAALKGVKNLKHPQPEGLVTVRIDPATGQLAASTQTNGIFETFRAEYVPQETGSVRAPGADPASGGDTPEQLF
jgi:penicillin-binding protein 1A